MCGRVAQSQRSLASAQTLFLVHRGAPDEQSIHIRTVTSSASGEREPSPSRQNNHETRKGTLEEKTQTHTPSNFNDKESTITRTPSSFRDNFNLSPGMTSVVFHATPTRTGITCSEKIWGLCPKSGSKSHPLPPGVSKHFSNLMYNARSDTLYEKKTFRPLALNGNTCIWCIDGFFEWKEPDKNVLSNQSASGKRKQPYFVYRKDGLPLIIPGLFTKVKTGRIVDATGKEETIDTFTLITAAACQPLKWLHHRQPCFIWDMSLAKEWLYNPCQELVTQFSTWASELKDEEESCLGWHPVKKDMSKLSYRDRDSVDAIKIEKVASVKSFFTSTSPKASAGVKRKSAHLNGPTLKRDTCSARGVDVEKTTDSECDTETMNTKRFVCSNDNAIIPQQSVPKKAGVTASFSPGFQRNHAPTSTTPTRSNKRTSSKTMTPSRNKETSTHCIEKKGSIMHFFSKSQGK